MSILIGVLFVPSLVGGLGHLAGFQNLPAGVTKTILELVAFVFVVGLLPIITYQYSYWLIVRAEIRSAKKRDRANQEFESGTIRRLDGTTRPRKTSDPQEL